MNEFGIILDETLKEKLKDLQEQVKKLKDQINKAIDEIEYNMQYDDNIDDYWVTTNKLLEILKGDNNEC